MPVYKSYQEKRLFEKYANADPESYITCGLHEWAMLNRYNKKVWNKACELRDAHDKEKKRVAKLVKEAGSSIVNLAIGVKNPTEWRVCSHQELPDPSPAEQLIIDQLNRYNIKWYREVEFMGLKFSEYGLARYDFLLQVPGTIHILEYDSALWHNKPENIVKDRLKTEFCNKHYIPITRYNKKDYYHMEKCIGDLMRQYGIKKKPW